MRPRLPSGRHLVPLAMLVAAPALAAPPRAGGGKPAAPPAKAAPAPKPAAGPAPKPAASPAPKAAPSAPPKAEPSAPPKAPVAKPAHPGGKAGSRSGTRPGPSAARAPTPRVPRGWGQTVQRWHGVDAETPRPRSADGRPLLVLEMLNTGERVELRPERDDGGFPACELDRAARALRDQRTGNEYPVDPRLLDLAYRIQVHFEAPAIRVLSGYRTPHAGGHSYHGRGRAMDMVVPGATDEDVATWVRSLGYVGVGIYPTCGFVHVDSRPHSFFWVDRSGPGQRNRTAAILGGQAADADRRAAERGERAPAPWAAPGHDAGSPSFDTHDGEDDDDESPEGVSAADAPEPGGG